MRVASTSGSSSQRKNLFFLSAPKGIEEPGEWSGVVCGSASAKPFKGTLKKNADDYRIEIQKLRFKDPCKFRSTYVARPALAPGMYSLSTSSNHLLLRLVAMETAGLLDESITKQPVHIRTDPITDHYDVEARPFASLKCRLRIVMSTQLDPMFEPQSYSGLNDFEIASNNY
ncbi:unnamed protein product [Larinioides sclopetarius]|uniref:Uncharacterized protein n=1 Tax=Larinioides sclopetarius TaxID=280406 RepID=A0AAV1Z545_9ARAC